MATTASSLLALPPKQQKKRVRWQMNIHRHGERCNQGLLPMTRTEQALFLAMVEEFIDFKRTVVVCHEPHSELCFVHSPIMGADFVKLRRIWLAIRLASRLSTKDLGVACPDTKSSWARDYRGVLAITLAGRVEVEAFKELENLRRRGRASGDGLTALGEITRYDGESNEP